MAKRAEGYITPPFPTDCLGNEGAEQPLRIEHTIERSSWDDIHVIQITLAPEYSGLFMCNDGIIGFTVVCRSLAPLPHSAPLHPGLMGNAA